MNRIISWANSWPEGKMFFGALFGIGSVFSQIYVLYWLVIIFVVVDFITGVIADYKAHKKLSKKWYFESDKCWRTIYKLGFALISVSLVWLVELYCFGVENPFICRYIAAFICGAEFWSFLENSSEISGNKLFLQIKKFTKYKMRDKLGEEFGESVESIDNSENKGSDVQ